MLVTPLSTQDRGGLAACMRTRGCYTQTRRQQELSKLALYGRD